MQKCQWTFFVYFPRKSEYYRVFTAEFRIQTKFERYNSFRVCSRFYFFALGKDSSFQTRRQQVR